MMYWISQNTGKCLTMNQLQHCLKRNFGGKANVDEMVERFLINIPANLIVSEQHASEIEVSGDCMHGSCHFFLLFCRAIAVLLMD